MDRTEIDGGNVRPVLILGIGNILLSDEGAGVFAADLIQEKYGPHGTIDIVDGGTLGMELIPILSGRRLIVIVDAVSGGHRPGTVTRIDDLPAFFQRRTSPHQIGIMDVLALSVLSGHPAPRTLMYGIEPKTMEPGFGLSPEVRDNLPYLAEKIMAYIKLDTGFLE